MRGVTPEFVNMSKEILYPKIRVLQGARAQLRVKVCGGGGKLVPVDAREAARRVGEAPDEGSGAGAGKKRRAAQRPCAWRG
jgi:hypothetical protein